MKKKANKDMNNIPIIVVHINGSDHLGTFQVCNSQSYLGNCMTTNKFNNLGGCGES